MTGPVRGVRSGTIPTQAENLNNFACTEDRT